MSDIDPGLTYIYTQRLKRRFLLIMGYEAQVKNHQNMITLGTQYQDQSCANYVQQKLRIECKYCLSFPLSLDFS